MRARFREPSGLARDLDQTFLATERLLPCTVPDLAFLEKKTAEKPGTLFISKRYLQFIYGLSTVYLRFIYSLSTVFIYSFSTYKSDGCPLSRSHVRPRHVHTTERTRDLSTASESR